MRTNADPRRETNLADEVQNPCARVQDIHSKSKTLQVVCSTNDNNNNNNNPSEPKLTHKPFETDCVC